MVNTQEAYHFITMPLIMGIVLFIFGTALFIIAIKRKYQRKQVAGLAEFTCSDRMVNTKKMEKAIRYIALVLLLSGFVIITYEALRMESQPSNHNDTAIN
ncbi:MAG: hypothetical protein EOO95_17360, partial [Pedobacter sp.]